MSAADPSAARIKAEIPNPPAGPWLRHTWQMEGWRERKGTGMMAGRELGGGGSCCDSLDNTYCRSSH